MGEVDLRPAGTRSEGVARSSIAFVPDRRALAVVGAAHETAPSDLLVVGAGAKAAAVAAKVDAINRLGLGPMSVTIIEGVEPAASWKGLNGMTSGDEPLAVTPVKDVGFPYESTKAFGDLGPQIDRAVMAHSWQQYLVGRGGWARWVNAETPAIRHRDYGVVSGVGAVARDRGRADRARTRAASGVRRGRGWLDRRGRGARRGSSTTRAARCCSPARAFTAISPTIPRPRRGCFTATASAETS